MNKINPSDLVIIDTLKKTNQIVVEVCKYIPKNKLFCVKTFKTSQIDEANKKYLENLNMITLGNENTAKLESCRILGNERLIDGIQIIFEYFPEGCLEQFLRNKRTPWTQEQLLDYAMQLVGALRHMQLKGACHRNISPKAIFLSNNSKTLKISDFDSSSFIAKQELTCLGHPSYSSPLVRNGLLIAGYSKILHDPFKSDVYSLGLVLLYMTTLVSPENIQNHSPYNEEILHRISIISTEYSRIKSLLYQMLAFEEENRPDFIKLYEEVEISIYKPGFICSFCKLFKCSEFLLKINIYNACQKCYLEFIEVKKYCSLCYNEHSLVDIYAFDEHSFYCNSCLNINTFEEFRLYCERCRELLNAAFECSCMDFIERCDVCKFAKHEGNCSDVLNQEHESNSLDVMFSCKCNLLYKKHIGGYYFYCSDENLSYCIVCCKAVEKKHTSCELLLFYKSLIRKNI